MDVLRLTREVRILKIYAVLSTTVLAVLFGASLVAQNQRQRFPEIDVERINIVEPDGRIALVLANTQRLPGPMLEGKELPKEISQGRIGSAGMIFVDAQGTEIGGLTYKVDVKGDGTFSASRSLTFDQHNQDQVVGLQYSDNGKTRAYGLNVWDRPTRITLKDLLGNVKDSVDRKALEARFRELAKERGETSPGARRVFLGSQERTAGLRIMDTEGRERIRVFVDPTGSSRMEFLDASGKVTNSLP
jgi:hypothetical protein